MRTTTEWSMEEQAACFGVPQSMGTYPWWRRCWMRALRGWSEEALWWASIRGNTSLATLLLDRGADLHYRDDTALCCAVNVGHIDMVRVLLQRNAIATSHVHDIAVELGHHVIAALLRAHGAV